MSDDIGPLSDGTAYSRRKGFRLLSVPPLDAYAEVVGQEKTERLLEIARRLEGLKLIEMNSTAVGGGVAEMLRSYVPLLDSLGIDIEWKVVTGNEPFFACTKDMHNLLQGMEGSFTPEMEKVYLSNLEECGRNSLIDYNPDVVTVHDPQPLCLTHYLLKPEQKWLWRCHIDIESMALDKHARLVDLIGDCIEHYDAAIFSAAHYVISTWPMPKFIIPPFIDPLSDKNRELSQEEIDEVLDKYNIDSRIPSVVQIGRFDPWKGIDRTIATCREVKRERKCQLVIAGGSAADDPQGERVLADILDETKGDENVRVLSLPPTSNLEINALQRSASVIMQPSTREGFGLVITEALWKGKPVIGSNIGGIPLQIRDGETSYFYEGPEETARKIIYLLDNPQAAESMGNEGRRYVKEHFLLPDRIADYLLAIEMVMRGQLDKKTCSECIVSYHPWYKLSKRGMEVPLGLH